LHSAQIIFCFERLGNLKYSAVAEIQQSGVVEEPGKEAGVLGVVILAVLKALVVSMFQQRWIMLFQLS
jgi:hypothetical protein